MGLFRKEESEMVFGSYQMEDVFPIEDSKLYDKLKKYGIKTVEFILFQKDKLMFIEAKKTTPNYNSDNNLEKYNDYISEISQKFCDSIDIYMSTYIGRQIDSEFSQKMKLANISDFEIRLLVVIKNAYEDSLCHYTDKLRIVLNRKMKKWSNCQLFVISEEQARKKGLIKNDC